MSDVHKKTAKKLLVSVKEATAVNFGPLYGGKQLKETFALGVSRGLCEVLHGQGEMTWLKITKKMSMPPENTEVILWDTHTEFPQVACGYVNYEGRFRGHGHSGAFDWFTHYALIVKPKGARRKK